MHFNSPHAPLWQRGEVVVMVMITSWWCGAIKDDDEEMVSVAAMEEVSDDDAKGCGVLWMGVDGRQSRERRRVEALVL
ncbi:hypothetical protein Tco_1499137 [Tanacetum coccineum]